MIRHLRTSLLLLTLCGGIAAAADPSRGELLYNTHCIACHTEQIHWRDKSVVTDRASLVAQVNRWQTNVKLEWGDEDIEEVAGYLNSLYYHRPPQD